MKKLFPSILVLGLGLMWCNVGLTNSLLVSSNGTKLNESALKYFDQNLIENKKKFIYKSKDNFMIFIDKEQIHIRNNDPKYTIVSIVEGQFMSFESCKKEIVSLTNLIKNNAPNAKTKFQGTVENPQKHWNDPSGKSLIFGTDFYLNESPKNGPIIRTSCTDWSTEIENSKNWQDNLKKTMNTKEYNLFLIEKVFPK